MKVTSTANLVTESIGDLTAEEKPPKKFKDMNNSERLSFIKEVVTLEPVIATYFFAAMICRPALISLETDKACKSDAGIAEEICDAIILGQHENYSVENTKQQTIVANMNSWATPAEMVIPIILVVFIGSFSDRHKIRKIFIIIPLVGELLAVIGCIINWFFMKEIPLIGLVILNRMVSSVFGNLTLLTMAVFSYIADNSTVEMRTLRVGLLTLSVNIFTTIGAYITGPVFEAIGYLPVLLLTWFLIFAAVLYTIFFVKEKAQVKVDKKVGLCRDIFNPNDFISTFSLLVKKTVGCNRLFVSLLLLIWICARIAASGPIHISKLFTQKVFLWTPAQQTHYEAVSTSLGLVGTSLGVFLFTKLIKLSDYNIVNLTLLLAAISEIIWSFSTNSVPFYVGAVVGMFGGMNTIGIRAISTKISTEENVGKIQSLMAVIEAVAITISAQYNQIYTATADTFPGTVFLVSALFSCITGGVVLFLNVLITRKENKKADEMGSRNNDGEVNGIQMSTTHI